MLIEMLNILEHFDLKAMGHNSPAYIATVSEAMKIATVDKDAKVGDPRFVDVPLAELMSKDYAANLAERIKSGEKTHVPRLKSGKESADTTHVTAVDEHGTCVSLTHTLGMPSGVVTEGLGFMYNGAMSAFDPRPGRPGSLAPGKSRFSAMAPSIVFKDDKPLLVLGAPGGTFISMGLSAGHPQCRGVRHERAGGRVRAALLHHLRHHRHHQPHPALDRARPAKAAAIQCGAGRMNFPFLGRACHPHRRRPARRRRRSWTRRHGDGV